MKISMNWINDYVDIKDLDYKELANKITMATAEVEEVITLGTDIKNVVTAKIISCEDIPESRKLHKLKVDTGDKIYECVCGAKNARQGLVVPFAKIGGFAGGMEIKKVELAGNISEGMCCSEKEIGFGDNHEGLMELPYDTELGKDIKEMLKLEDTIIEIDNKSLTNRPDLWGHYGIAREIAAITGRELRKMPISDLEKYNNLSKIPAEIETDKCIRYACMEFKNVTYETAPYEMQIRLFYCGMRSISFLVDLTNYIMLDIGQPMHAFEREGIEKIIVRQSRGEEFTTLDDITRKIDTETMFICNQDEPIGLAGVMGGKNSEVTKDTKSIILESANFDAYTIRKTAMKLNMRTEASARYEKTLDIEFVPFALARFVYLLTMIDKGAEVTSGITDVINVPQDEIKIEITKQYIDKYIGENLPKEKILSILKSLEFGVVEEGEKFIIDVPSFRASKDITVKADIIEEISRMYGFDNIKPVPTKTELTALKENIERNTEHQVKEILAYDFDLSEVHSYIWYDNKFNEQVGIGYLEGLKIMLPSAPEFSNIRQIMAPTLLKFANENKKHFDDFGMFEIGSILQKNVEEKKLGILLASKTMSENDIVYKLKSIIDKMVKVIKNVELKYDKCEEKYKFIHPIKSAKILYKEREIGYISSVHPKVKNNIDKKLNLVIAEINMKELNNIKKENEKFIEPAKYPVISYDLSLLIKKEAIYANLIEDALAFKSNILKDVKFVDIYEGKGLPEGKKSITLNFTWGADDHTLITEELELEKEKLIKYLGEKGYENRY